MRTTHKDDVRHGRLADRWEEGFWYAGKLDPNEYITETRGNSPETLRVLASYGRVCTRMCGLSGIRAKSFGDLRWVQTVVVSKIERVQNVCSTAESRKHQTKSRRPVIVGSFPELGDRSQISRV